MIGKTLSHVPTFASLNIRYRKTFGHRLRDAIAMVGHYMRPIKKYVFPNFLAVHYFYIILMTILTSILLYPVRNAPYIDILFIAAGCTTQGGLNTINLNDLTLYQQIVLYIICFFCTPIAIHGCLAFVRLYWFERYFDGIRDSSRKNFKMRRTRTLLERELTGRPMSMNPQRHTRTESAPDNSASAREDFQEKLFSGKMLFRDEDGESNHSADGPNDNGNANKVGDSNGSSWSSSNTVKDSSSRRNLQTSGALTFNEPLHKRDRPAKEKFVSRRRSADISPEDMYRSIKMMTDQHHEGEGEEEGPPLVISAPTAEKKENYKGDKSGKSKSGSGLNSETSKEKSEASDINRENLMKNDANRKTGLLEQSTEYNQGQEDALTPAHSANLDSNSDELSDKDSTSDQQDPNVKKKGPLIQFDISEQPKRKIMNSGTTSSNTRYSRSMPKKAFLKGIKKGKGLRQKIRRRLSTNSFEKKEPYTTNDDEDNVEYYADDDASDEERNIQTPKAKNRPLNKALSFDQSDHARLNASATRGLRKTGSFDVRNAKDLDKLAQSPDFQAMIYHNWKKRHKKQPLLKRRGSKNKKISDNEYGTDTSEDQETENTGNKAQWDGTRANEYRKFSSHANSTANADSEDVTDNQQVENQESDSYAGYNGNDEEQAYYGFELDPNFEATRNRPRLARTMSSGYLSWQPTIGRNSTFIGLSKMQKEELGGVEYTSIKLLCRILLFYYFGFFVMAFVMILPWILSMNDYKEIVRSDGISPTWWGFFTSLSAFMDLGFTLTPDSMSSFNKAIYPLIVMMWFIVIGNTGFPVLLRFIIWIMFKLSPELSQRRENLGFLLDHPRRCFTLLFPSGATWWLLATLIFLNATDLVLFIILDFNSKIVKSLSRGYRVLDGLFQSISTRTAGFTVVDLSMLHPSIQVSYMLMMYVSVLPLAISIRRTNVYEEQSLGMYGEMNEDETEGGNDDNRSSKVNTSTHDDAESDDNTTSDDLTHTSQKPKKKLMNESFIGAHLRKQLSFDLWFLFLGLFIICICEGGKIEDTDKPNFNVFAILFEIVSAYGTVGLSFGYPNTDTSFSGQFTTLSKLIIIAMLIRGRHRGLPYALDRAIMLPSKSLDKIDHIQDLKLKRGTSDEARSNTMDPVTAYFKRKSHSLGKRLRELRGVASDQEDHLLHSYRAHNENLSQNGDTIDYPLQDNPTSQSHNSTQEGPSSLDTGVNYDDDSYDDRSEAQDRASFSIDHQSQ